MTAFEQFKADVKSILNNDESSKDDKYFQIIGAMSEYNRVLSNNFKFSTELVRILEAQIEPQVFRAAKEQAQINCRHRFIKKSKDEVVLEIKNKEGKE